MRVVGGVLAGRLIACPPGMATRPTLDRVRESLFNVLARRVPGAAVLDLYAGSGALAIEALSRGADHADVVEHSGRAAAVLRRNVAQLALADRVRVWPLAAERAVLKLAPASFDLIFLDPPWRAGVAQPVWAAVPQLLRPDGLAVLEFEDAQGMPGIPGTEGLEEGGMVVVDHRRYGRTGLTLLGRR